MMHYGSRPREETRADPIASRSAASVSSGRSQSAVARVAIAPATSTLDVAALAHNENDSRPSLVTRFFLHPATTYLNIPTSAFLSAHFFSVSNPAVGCFMAIIFVASFSRLIRDVLTPTA